jgi:hypothetical protein
VKLVGVFGNECRSLSRVFDPREERVFGMKICLGYKSERVNSEICNN